LFKEISVKFENKANMNLVVELVEVAEVVEVVEADAVAVVVVVVVEEQGLRLQVQ